MKKCQHFQLALDIQNSGKQNMPNFKRQTTFNNIPERNP